MSIARACFLINRLIDSEDFARALSALAKAGQRYPEAEAVWLYWTGWVFLRQEAPGRALAAMESARQKEPNAREFLYGVACANSALGLFHEVMFCAKISSETIELAHEKGWGCLITDQMRALERNLFVVDPNSVLHKVQESMARGDYLRAAFLAEDALSAFPQNRSWRIAAIEAFLAADRPFSALELFVPLSAEQSLSLCEQVLIARVFAALGQHRQALVWHDAVFRRDPSLSSNRLAFLSMLSSMRRPLPSPFSDLRGAMQNAERTAGKTPRKAHPRQSTSSDRIRIGIVSPNLQGGTIDSHVALLFETFKASNIEVFLYIDSPQKDALTERFLSSARESLITHAIDDTTLARILFEDEIDIMLELDSNVRYRRHASARLKPTPLQLVAFGDPLEAHGYGYDAVLSDVFLTPREPQAAEKSCPVLRTPHGFLHLVEMFPTAPASVRRAIGGVRFGVSARFFDEEARRLLRACMSAAPSSRLVLDTEGLGGGKAASFLKGELEVAEGRQASNSDRISLMPQGSNSEAFLKCTDVFLDISYPRSPYMLWQALRRALPAVTLGGESLAQRLGVSLVAQQMPAAGQALCIADDERCLLQKVKELATTPSARQGMKQAIRQGKQKNPAQSTAVKALAVAQTLLEGFARQARHGRYDPNISTLPPPPP